MSKPMFLSPEWWASRADVNPVITCTAEEDMCRQEYGLSADIKYQIQTFGVGHRGENGTVDYDQMDLTSALALVEESSRAWLQLPAVVRERYGSWAHVETAAQNGELEQLLKAAGVNGASPLTSAASASDSAPVTPPAGVSPS